MSSNYVFLNRDERFLHLEGLEYRVNGESTLGQVYQRISKGFPRCDWQHETTENPNGKGRYFKAVFFEHKKLGSLLRFVAYADPSLQTHPLAILEEGRRESRLLGLTLDVSDTYKKHQGDIEAIVQEMVEKRVMLPVEIHRENRGVPIKLDVTTAWESGKSRIRTPDRRYVH